MPLLNEVQLRTLTSAIDRMVPADEFPSASQAGCVDFLLRLIQLEHLEQTYRAGLDSVEARALKLGKSFADLTPDQQDAQLQGRQPKEQRRFIELLARQTIEGYYADPGNGGNRDCVSWKMVGFEVRN